MDRPSPERNNIKVIGLIKDELGKKKGNSSEDRKEKGTNLKTIKTVYKERNFNHLEKNEIDADSLKKIIKNW